MLINARSCLLSTLIALSVSVQAAEPESWSIRGVTESDAIRDSQIDFTIYANRIVAKRGAPDDRRTETIMVMDDKILTMTERSNQSAIGTFPRKRQDQFSASQRQDGESAVTLHDRFVDHLQTSAHEFKGEADEPLTRQDQRHQAVLIAAHRLLQTCVWGPSPAGCNEALDRFDVLVEGTPELNPGRPADLD